LASYFWAIGTLIIAVMIMISTFACNNGLIMTGARILHHGSRRYFFKKAAELNKFSVPEWSHSSTVFLGFGFMSYG
jgi:APA family basic amino acid/polyamine antiporter